MTRQELIEQTLAEVANLRRAPGPPSRNWPTRIEIELRIEVVGRDHQPAPPHHQRVQARRRLTP